MSRSAHGWKLAIGILGLSLAGCAGSYPVPTQAMAKAAMEIHRAEQAGARHQADSAQLCAQAEQALEASRHAVKRGKNRESEVLAQRGYEYAHLARAKAPAEPASSPLQPALTLARYP